MKNKKETLVLIFAALILSPSAGLAAPQDGKVVSGSANIRQSGATTTINQKSNRAIINWKSFDIGKNEAVRHNMPSSKAAGLHRVVGGGGASQIQGRLQSNGNVYLVNPAGVVIHKGARVDTNGFVATTRDIADANFMKGKMVFDGPGRPDAEIVNQGSISVKESGLAALVAPTVRNEGVIAGKLAKVALASGDAAWTLDMHGDDLITFTVNEEDVNTLYAADGTPLAGVENSGSIKAEGGVVVLTAAQLDGIVGSVVNSGEVSAASAELKGGKITFRGQGSDVDIVNTGSVDVSSAVADGGTVRMDTDGKTLSFGTIAATGGQKGGKVTLTGREVALSSTSKIDVSGNTGGGTALVGGNALGKGPERNAQKATVERGATIHADARGKGDGGQVVVWSDEKTTFDGTITAKGGSEGGNGGQVETSGKILKLGDAARVNTLALRGKAGQWLLDPVDFTIAVSGGDMTGATVSANLEMGDVIIRSEDGQGGSNGNINVNDKIEWFSNFGLTLDAANSVNVNNNIILHGDYSSLNIITLPSGHIYIDTGSYNINKGKISFLGKYNKYFINGNDYKLIKTIEELQNLDINHDFYALARDIDASSTKIWNGGSGFVPLEGVTGALNGGNHVIKGLYINSPDKNSVGLVGWTRFFMVDNLGLLDVNITGYSDVGGLIGTAYGSDVRIRNVGVTGSVTGIENVGGVLGKYSPSSGDIYRSYSTANVSGYSNVGGFAGYLNRGVWGSYSSGDVSGQTNIGGFVGYADGGGYTFSYSTGNILGNPLVAGRFAGYAKNAYLSEDYKSLGFIGYAEKCHFNDNPAYSDLNLNVFTFGAYEVDPGTGGGTTDPGTGGPDEPDTPIGPPVMPDDGNDSSDRIPPKKEVIYVDGKNAIEVELDPDNNKVIIVLSDEQIAIRELQKGLSGFINTIEDGIWESREWTTKRNQKIFEIYGVQGVFSSITEAIVHIGTGNPLGILDSVGGFLTNSNLAEAGLNLILSEYFFHESLKSAKKAEDILNKSGILDADEMKLAIDHLITSRIYELTGIGISKEKIDEITKVANYPFLLKVLYWSADTAKVVGENLVMSGLKVLGKSPTNIQLGVLDDGNIREIPALLTTQGQIKNMINKSMPYVEGVYTMKGYLNLKKKLINNAEGALANDGLLNNLITLRSSLDSI